MQELLLKLVTEHFGSILVFVLVLLGWWGGYLDKVLSFVGKLENYYDWLRQKAVEKHLYELAQKGYDYADDLARMAKKTETELDDKVVEKATVALEWVIKAMKKMGLEDTPEARDVIKGYFGHFHEAEKKAKELTGALPLAPKPEETDSEG